MIIRQYRNKCRAVNHASAHTRTLLQTLHDFQDVFHIRERAWSVALTKAHHAVFVHHEDGAETDATFFVPQAIGLRHLALGMPIRQFRVR